MARLVPRLRADKYDADLERNPANFQSLTPLTFLERAASVFPSRTAIIHGTQRFSYADYYARSRRLASALTKKGLKKGDTVAVMLANTPPMLEAHYGVPMAGGVLNCLNTRLDAPALAFILDHGEAKFLITDREFATVMKETLKLAKAKPLVIDYDDLEFPQNGERLGSLDYESLVRDGDADFSWSPPGDEWDAISLNSTSGTTGNPKGVVFHHRGAALMGYGNVLAAQMPRHPIYLWTLPMFHCNGWTYTWAVTAAGGTHVCLRRVLPEHVFAAIREHRVTHLCGAPIVLNMLIHAPTEVKAKFDHIVDVATGGAAPPSAVIEAMERMGFRVTHLYGLTESYGPATLCAWQRDWDPLPMTERAQRMARQGVPMPTLAALQVADPHTALPVPRDGATIGEVMLRGNTIMKGYLDNPTATEAAFAGGWYRTGDLAVWHPDSYIEIKDRTKDIIVSGGENISSLEIEECLYRHPQVMEAAVVARPDSRWGETPCAFVMLKQGAAPIAAADIIGWCREHLAHFKVPKTVVFGPLPKTATGKIQKFVLRDRAREMQVD